MQPASRPVPPLPTLGIDALSPAYLSPSFTTTPAEFLSTVTGAPSAFADVAGRLEAAHAAGGALRTPNEACDVVNECFAEFHHSTLTGI